LLVGTHKRRLLTESGLFHSYMVQKTSSDIALHK
jgi:hypothetical protein